jgi:hypothetical protein
VRWDKSSRACKSSPGKASGVGSSSTNRRRPTIRLIKGTHFIIIMVGASENYPDSHSTAPSKMPNCLKWGEREPRGQCRLFFSLVDTTCLDMGYRPGDCSDFCFTLMARPIGRIDRETNRPGGSNGSNGSNPSMNERTDQADQRIDERIKRINKQIQ